MDSQLQVCIYLIPSRTECNHVATYLARKDEWYRKQVYSPFLKQCVMPALLLEQETVDAFDDAATGDDDGQHSPSEEDNNNNIIIEEQEEDEDDDEEEEEGEDEEEEEPHRANKQKTITKRIRSAAAAAAMAKAAAAAAAAAAVAAAVAAADEASASASAERAGAGAREETYFRIPMQFRHTLLQDYVRGAHYNTQFRVYECACWVAADNKGPPDMVVPFCSFAQVGLAAACTELLRLQENNRISPKKPGSSGIGNNGGGAIGSGGKSKPPLLGGGKSGGGNKPGGAGIGIGGKSGKSGSGSGGSSSSSSSSSASKEAEKQFKAEVEAMGQLKKSWKTTFPKLRLQYAQTEEAFSATPVVRGWVYQTQGEDYASITLRSVPDQGDLTPSDLPARESLELEQVKFSKDFKDKFKSKTGLRGLTE
jgi:hypothetical protein